MELEKALEYLPLVIEKDIRHINYKRVCDLSELYFAYYTGFGLDKHLQQIVSTETKEEFDQRILLTKHITPAILNSTKMPFNKALRRQAKVKIDFAEGQNETKITEIKEYLDTFNGVRSLNEYLEVLFVDYNYHDPNAWLIVEFEPNDVTRKAQPYPFIANSKEAIDFKFNNGILDYLIVMLPTQYKKKVKENGIDKIHNADGYKYTLYAGNQTIVIENVDYDYTPERDEDESESEKIIFINEERYSLEVYQVQANNDPELTPAAIRFGYISDSRTNHQTFLSIFECAMPYIEKTLKVNSELDQSMSMVAFPQRYMYEVACNAEGCYKGKMTHDGSDCQACKGTGVVQIHSGTQQIMKLPLPNNKEEMIDLNQLFANNTPPIDLLTFDNDYIKQLKIDIHTTIFNMDLISKTEVSTTATEQLLNRDNMNDTLFPFARHYSEVWKNCVYFIAVYTDNVNKLKNGSDIIIEHKFPYDFKLKTLTELMADLKTAYDSKASTATITAIEDDINDILYYDRPDELKKIKTINQYNPFRGNSPDEVKLLISSGLVSKYDQVLYSNLSNIFTELERENSDPWFYDLDEKKIFDLVQAKVNERIKNLDGEKPKEVNRLDLSQPNKEPEVNEVSIIYDEQIQINFKTNKKFTVSNDDLIIVPVVLMTEGVHIGSHGAILHKISELGKVPASWNGIPITINHPKKEDKYVSANNPEILKSLSVGRIFNTRVEDEKLISEAWFEKDKLNSLSPKLLNDIVSGNEIEVSIGAFPEYKMIQGDWNNEKYDAIAVNYRPDHLAVLPDSEGACSNNDGAGINVNGGEGSGNFDHEGRPGLIGGSASNNNLKMGTDSVYYDPKENKIHVLYRSDIYNISDHFRAYEEYLKHDKQTLFYRATNNENEHLIENLISTNHLTGEKEKGLSVSYTDIYKQEWKGAQPKDAFRYIGIVSGEIVGFGSDREPLLKNVKWVHPPVNKLPKKYNVSNVEKKRTLKDNETPWRKLSFSPFGNDIIIGE